MSQTVRSSAQNLSSEGSKPQVQWQCRIAPSRAGPKIRRRPAAGSTTLSGKMVLSVALTLRKYRVQSSPLAESADPRCRTRPRPRGIRPGSLLGGTRAETPPRPSTRPPPAVPTGCGLPTPKYAGATTSSHGMPFPRQAPGALSPCAQKQPMAAAGSRFQNLCFP